MAEPSTTTRGKFDQRLGRIPIFIAAGTVSLTLVGLCKVAGAFIASEVDVSEALGLTPPDRYVREAVGIFGDAAFWIIAGAYSGMFVLVQGVLWLDRLDRRRRAEKRKRDQAEGEGSAKIATLPSWFFDYALYGFMIGLSLVLAVTDSWTMGLYGAISTVAMIVGVHVRKWSTWAKRDPGTVYVLVFIAAVFLISAINALTYSRALSHATMTVDGQFVSGDLIGVYDGMIYLTGENSGERYRSVPLGKASLMRVTKGERRAYPDTVPELFEKDD